MSYLEIKVELTFHHIEVVFKRLNSSFEGAMQLSSPPVRVVAVPSGAARLGFHDSRRQSVHNGPFSCVQREHFQRAVASDVATAECDNGRIVRAVKFHRFGRELRQRASASNRHALSDRVLEEERRRDSAIVSRSLLRRSSLQFKVARGTLLYSAQLFTALLTNLFFYRRSAYPK